MSGCQHTPPGGTKQGGFTLLELSLVVLVMGVIMAIVGPRMLPAILFSGLDGSARHLTGYGRSLLAYCAIEQQMVTFHVDLDNGEYWTERWVLEDETVDDEDFGGGLDSDDGTYHSSSSGYSNSYTSEKDLEQQMDALGDQMQTRFERFMKMSIESKARNLSKNEDSILSDVGPLFEKQFSLDWEDTQYVEVKTDLLSRVVLPEDIHIVRMWVGGEEYTNGEVTVDASGLGFDGAVEFVLQAGEDRYYTVVWDAVTGTPRMFEGLSGNEDGW